MNSRKIGLLLLSGLFLSASVLFPAFNFLIWVAFVPVLILISESNFRQSVFYGLFCGTTFLLSLLSWIIQYELRILVIVLSLTIPFFAGFAFLVRLFWNRYPHQSMIRIFAVPFAWFLIQLIYSFTAMNIIGNQIAFLQAPHFPGIVRVAGLSGITFLVLLVNSLIAHLSLRGGQRPTKQSRSEIAPRASARVLFGKNRKFFSESASLILFARNDGLILIIILGILIFGFISKPNLDQIQPLSVALVQHNFPIDHEWREKSKRQIMEFYERTVREHKDADLIAFPQYGLPVDVLRKPEIFNRLAQTENTSIILATYIPKIAGGNLDSGERTDSALVFSPDQTVQEYQAVTAPPFRRIGQVLGNVRKTLRIHNAAAGVLLCYEDTNSNETRQWILNGAEFLISLSNPGHFLGTNLPFYHLIHDRIRAIETGKYLIRISPNGFSGIVNPNGELIRASHLNEAVILRGAVYPNNQKTWFVKLGDVTAGGSAAIAAILLLLSYVLNSINFFARRTR